MTVGGVAQDVQGHVTAAAVVGDIGVGDGWDVVIAEPEEDVAVELRRESGAVPCQERLDVALAGPPDRLCIVGRDHRGGDVVVM